MAVHARQRRGAVHGHSTYVVGQARRSRQDRGIRLRKCVAAPRHGNVGRPAGLPALTPVVSLSLSLSLCFFCRVSSSSFPSPPSPHFVNTNLRQRNGGSRAGDLSRSSVSSCRRGHEVQYTAPEMGVCLSPMIGSVALSLLVKAAALGPSAAAHPCVRPHDPSTLGCPPPSTESRRRPRAEHANGVFRNMQEAGKARARASVCAEAPRAAKTALIGGANGLDGNLSDTARGLEPPNAGARGAKAQAQHTSEARPSPCIYGRNAEQKRRMVCFPTVCGGGRHAAETRWLAREPHTLGRTCFSPPAPPTGTLSAARTSVRLGRLGTARTQAQMATACPVPFRIRESLERGPARNTHQAGARAALDPRRAADSEKVLGRMACSCHPHILPTGMHRRPHGVPQQQCVQLSVVLDGSPRPMPLRRHLVPAMHVSLRCSAGTESLAETPGRGGGPPRSSRRSRRATRWNPSQNPKDACVRACGCRCVPVGSHADGGSGGLCPLTTIGSHAWHGGSSVCQACG